MTLDLFGPKVNRDGVPPFRCILADPPWAERGGGKIKRGADRHYGLMEAGEIHEAIVESDAWNPAEDAHLWCWVTDNFLRDGLTLIESLGFRYVRTFQWVKVQGGFPTPLDFDTGYACDAPPQSADGTPRVKIGIGQYARGAHEMMLFAVRGRGQSESVWTGDRGVPSVFFAPHERDQSGKVIHSRKPRASYELIERVSKGPRLECFARIARPGWSVWGNQAPT